MDEEMVVEVFKRLPEDEFGLMSCESLASRIRENNSPFVLDIRRESDWKVAHISKSVHCEWQNVGDMVRSGLLPREKDIAVVCYVGQSSGQVTGILRMLGYRVYSLLDGFNKWEEDGFEVERST